MKFTKDEIQHYNQKISQIFTEYCADHNFTVHHIESGWSSSFLKFYMGPKDTQYPFSFKVTILDSKDYFKEHKFFDEKLKVISPVQISDDRQQFIKPKDFWQFADDRLDKKGQVLFQRIITHTFQAHAFQTLIQERSDEQNWFYIKHIHDGERKTGTQGEFNIFFDFVKTQKLDTDEKIQNFYILCKHSRNIIKRPEYNPVVCDFINENIPKEFHENFELLLGRQIKRDIQIYDPSDIMEVKPSQTIILDKNKCFEKIQFSGDKIPNINNLNSLNFNLVRALNENCMKQLGLDDVLTVPFTSDTNPAKITFVFSSSEHRSNMPEIYVALLEQCGALFDEKGNYNVIRDNVVSTVNHFLLSQKLSQKNSDTPRVKL